MNIRKECKKSLTKYYSPFYSSNGTVMTQFQLGNPELSAVADQYATFYSPKYFLVPVYDCNKAEHLKEVQLYNIFF